MCIRDSVYAVQEGIVTMMRHGIADEFEGKSVNLESHLLLGRIMGLAPFSYEGSRGLVLVTKLGLHLTRLNLDRFYLHCLPSLKFNTTVDKTYKLRAYSRGCAKARAEGYNSHYTACWVEVNVRVWTHSQRFASQNIALIIGALVVSIIGISIGVALCLKIKYYKTEYEKLLSQPREKPARELKKRNKKSKKEQSNEGYATSSLGDAPAGNLEEGSENSP
eukprot:TRINITY_DN8526_c0_g1_i3.p1 TRINITY_DN8526_c0_g1~~TRINITY_DN8526_c0_g1_i3.p1  ORF type:complete len:220 (+),score=41.07 TRINITY_DN8526_c0_g1_i3:65-724(+)